MRLWLKILMVLGMTLAILLPLVLVRGTIQERQAYRQEAVREVARSFGGRQVFGGPVLVVPYVETVAEPVSDGAGTRTVERRRQRTWTFFPDTLSIDGELVPDTRRRGLHEVRVYQWNGLATARFNVRLPEAEASAARELGQPWLSYGIADVRGLQGTPLLQVNGQGLVPLQGLGHADGPGVHVRLPAPGGDGRIVIDTRLELQLRGTEAFAMMPYGRSNELRLRSSWPHPKFEGLSPRHDVSEAGFEARWQVASVATNAQRGYLRRPALAPPAESAIDATRLPEAAGDGVRVLLVDPVNPYLQAERATKYGLLFVLLTFVGFFLFELFRSLRVHPIQYGLVGLAIAIFFLLLVSLGERLPFGLAYLCAATACIGLIGVYLAAVLRSTARGLGFAAMLATLYAALYGLLASEDNALLLGAGLLFVILAAIMLATRKVDWYALAATPPRAG